MIFQRNTSGKVLIKPEALQKMELYKQSFWGDEPESGGILLGRWLKDSNNVIIDDVTVPGPRDKQKRYRFFRFRGDHEPILPQAWEDSDGTIDYLGEWHTHPDLSPQPSRVDRRVWRNLLTHRPSLFFIIWGYRKPHLWEGVQSNEKPEFKQLKHIKPQIL